MKIFHLPDLGEGLPEGTIREWFVQPGDEIEVDQPMVSIETAKALVEVPAPYSGKIEQCFANVDDTVATGAPLVGFIDQTNTVADPSTTSTTVVGNIATSETVLSSAQQHQTTTHKATPSARALARRSGIALDSIDSKNNPMRQRDVQHHIDQHDTSSHAISATMTPLTPQQRAMSLAMQRAHQQVAQATLCDEANISQRQHQGNITVQVIRAIRTACLSQPTLNGIFDAHALAFEAIDALNLALAIDTPNGLFTPVIRDVDQYDDPALKACIDRYKSQAQSHSIAAEDLRGASFTLSNVGTIAGQFATPMVTPPQVAILAVGRVKIQPAVHDKQLVTQQLLPLSLSFDHRVITGGEAARFLKCLIDALEAN